MFLLQPSMLLVLEFLAFADTYAHQILVVHIELNHGGGGAQCPQLPPCNLARTTFFERRHTIVDEKDILLILKPLLHVTNMQIYIY